MYTRFCPKCHKELFHKDGREGEKANAERRLCRLCSSLARWNTPGARETAKIRMKGHKPSAAALEAAAQFHHRQSSGENNPMFGRTPHDIWTEKYGREEADRRKRESDAKPRKLWAGDVRRVSQQRIIGSRSMRGRSFYSTWITKYGKAEADLLLDGYKERKSLANSGPKNPMFGKPSPQGSGSGWSGWYQGHFFRSLLELSFMMQLLKEGISWETGEQQSLAISYEWKGKIRTYFPDFCLRDKTIEVKPLRLLGTGQNQAKFAAARARWGDNFKVVTDKDVVKIQGTELKALCESGEVVLLEKWQTRI